MRRLLPLPLLILGLVACVDDRVRLQYHLEPGRRLVYRLTLSAEIKRGLEGETRTQEVRASFRAVQEVLEPLPEGGARAGVSLIPESLTVNGRPVDAGGEQEFLVGLDVDGSVVSLSAPAGTPAEVLGPVGIERLLPRLRPVLPASDVAVGEEWEASSSIVDEEGRFSLTTSSRLGQLGIADGHEAAFVRTAYRSPVAREEEFQNAVAELRGQDEGAQETWFALDGFLVSAVGDSVGTYGVTFMPPGGEEGLAPVEGSLVVRLHTELNLLSEG